MPSPVAKRVWASLEREPGEVIVEAMLEAERHDPERVKHWVVLVDGAETQLDLVEASAAEFGVEVTVILDIIHVVEYVWKAAHVFHREGSPELSHWAWTRVRSILEGKATRVAASMRRAATVAGFSRDTRKPVDTCADYLLKYAPYLHYDRYLAPGYPIATGVIEGACRYLVRDRMELTGARWRLVGAEAVLKLRSLRASGDFDEYWDFHEAREYERNHAQRYSGRIVPPVTEPPRRITLRDRRPSVSTSPLRFCDSVSRCPANAELFCGSSGGQSSLDEFLRGGNCVRVEWRSTRCAPAFPGRGDAVAGPLGDEPAFEVRDGAEDVEHEFAGRGRGIEALLEAEQVDAAGLEVVDGFEQLPE